MVEPILIRDWPRYECLQEKARRYPQLDVGAVEATLMLLRVAQEVMAGLSAQYERHHISQGRFMVLMILDRYQDRSLPPSELAEKIGVARATITGLVDGLEKEGLVARNPHPDDRRALTINLTLKGREFLNTMLPGHYRRVAGLMEHLDEDERQQFIALLAKVNAGTNALQDAQWSGAEPDFKTAPTELIQLETDGATSAQ